MKNGASFESFVAYVYQSLLDLSSFDSIVSKNVSIKGLSGLVSEFDVYYEFNHLNMRFRVAIECKDWSKAVDVSQVRDFGSKISDLNNIAGVFIARSGYQTGAKQYAEKKGILLLTIDDLPTLPQLLGAKISKLLLPDEHVMGEPFWALLGTNDTKPDGTYYSLPDEPEVVIPLFFSKNVAKQFHMAQSDPSEWCVRGISQNHLSFLIDMPQPAFAVCILPTVRSEIQFIYLSKQDVKANYLFR